jgi:hypothetical protein
MSSLTGGLIVAGGLIAEEVLVTSKGGPALLTGIAGTIATVIDHFGDPTVPAIPNPAGYQGTTSLTPADSPAAIAAAKAKTASQATPPLTRPTIPGTSIPVP